MEGDAGTRQLNPTDADETPDESLAVSTEDQTEEATEPASPEPADEAVDDGRRPSHLGVGWVASICAALLLLAAGVGVGGYLALRSHHDSEAHCARRGGGAAGGQGLRGGDAGAGHRGDDRRADEDHRMLDG